MRAHKFLGWSRDRDTQSKGNQLKVKRINEKGVGATEFQKDKLEPLAHLHQRRGVDTEVGVANHLDISVAGAFFARSVFGRQICRFHDADL
jgi:hypothetical protein